MLCLINTNRMTPPIAPIGIEYLAGAARASGIETTAVDLCLTDDPSGALRVGLGRREPRVVGLSFRNVDDCYWPRGEWFVPGLVETVREIRSLTTAPIVLGGVGFSLFPDRILAATGADFGVRGDGEPALVQLYRELEGDRRFDRVPGLIWRSMGGAGRKDEGAVSEVGCAAFRSNRPSWPSPLLVESSRNALDNVAYFRKGGQAGVETKRGCGRPCIYCADPIAKGRASRVRPPTFVADEIEALLLQGVNVLHLCDSEFNLPIEHARAVCDEIVRRGIAKHLRWYAYLAVKPFDEGLAASCSGLGASGSISRATRRTPSCSKTTASPIVTRTSVRRSACAADTGSRS
jgi:hypothetical protein